MTNIFDPAINTRLPQGGVVMYLRQRKNNCVQVSRPTIRFCLKLQGLFLRLNTNFLAEKYNLGMVVGLMVLFN